MNQFEILEARAKHFIIGMTVSSLGVILGVLEWVYHAQGKYFVLWAGGFLTAYCISRTQQFWKWFNKQD